MSNLMSNIVNEKKAMVIQRLLFAIFFACIVLMISAPAASAVEKEGHLKLLAVSESEEGNFTGSIADLYLTIKDGSGNVYIQTYPLLKVDTQISTRFGKDMACNYLNIDCSKYDFFYTIKASSPIVGGPSAGSAITALTVLLLDNKKIDESVSMTGTINSGGVIGPVGGVLEKIDAAAQNSIKKVLVPVSEMEVERGNETINVTQYGAEKGITVAGVATIDDIIYEMTGEKPDYPEDIVITEYYKITMREIADNLCERADDFSKEMSKNAFLLNKTDFELLNSSLALIKRSGEAMSTENYYSAASYCFGANVKLSELKLNREDMDKETIETLINVTLDLIKSMQAEIDSKAEETLTDLETYLIVTERLDEARLSATKAYEALQKNKSVNAEVAYSIERIESAKYWSEFFGKPGKKYLISKETLAESCSLKIDEAVERAQFLELFLPNSSYNIGESLSKAREYQAAGNYKLCLFKASQAKAQADMVLSVLGISESQLQTFIEQKLQIAKRVIAKQSLKGNFPIMGFSYYEYAKSLMDNDPTSALIYSEYALELSNLDIYFPQKSDEGKLLAKEEKGDKNIDNIIIPIALFFVSGLIFGFVLAEFFHILSKKRIKKRY